MLAFYIHNIICLKYLNAQLVSNKSILECCGCKRFRNTDPQRNKTDQRTEWTLVLDLPNSIPILYRKDFIQQFVSLQIYMACMQHFMQYWSCTQVRGRMWAQVCNSYIQQRIHTYKTNFMFPQTLCKSDCNQRSNI